MSLRFCANISWLFAELPEYPRRLQAAASAGFRAVEAAWLYDTDPGDLRRVKEQAGLEIALINTPPGDLKHGELGLGAVPGRELEFRQGLTQAIHYAKALDCKRIHLMAGRVPAGAQRAAVAMEMEATFVQNLRHAADMLAKEGILGLIEPINTRITDPQYFLNSPHQAYSLLHVAAAILQKVDRPNIKLQLDVYHWQIMDGNLTMNIQKYFPLIGKRKKNLVPLTGHVQVAQVPGRHEPDSAGEVSFPYLFSLLEELGYDGYVGCEYKPL
ncbi:hypothetical protein P4O66_009837, partial [Electrophorus voltai]